MFHRLAILALVAGFAFSPIPAPAEPSCQAVNNAGYATPASCHDHAPNAVVVAWADRTVGR